MAEPATRAPEHLEPNSLGLVEATVQSGADIAPAVSVVSVAVFLSTLAGIASPLAVLLGTIVALSLCKVVSDYAKRMASPGAFYTFLTRVFGPKTGFTFGFLLFICYWLLILFQLPFFGQFVQGILVNEVNIPWWLWSAFLIVFSCTLVITGVRPSLRFGLVGLAFECIVFLSLSILIVSHGGANGNSFKPFEFSSGASASGVFLGIIFGLFAFVGFEQSTTLAEETRNPFRTIPRSLYLAVGTTGALIVFFLYACVIGFGTTAHGLAALQGSSIPYVELARRYGNSTLVFFVNACVFTSFLALNIACVTAATRVLFTISRDGLAPSVLSRLNKRLAPGNAAIGIGVASLVVTLVAGGIWGALQVSNWFAFLSTMCFIAVYATACIGVPLFYYRELRQHFSILGNVVIPLIALAGMGCVLYGNLHPFPAAPERYFPAVTIVLIIGLALWARQLSKRHPERVRLAAQHFVTIDAVYISEEQGTQAQEAVESPPAHETSQQVHE